MILTHFPVFSSMSRICAPHRTRGRPLARGVGVFSETISTLGIWDNLLAGIGLDESRTNNSGTASSSACNRWRRFRIWLWFVWHICLTITHLHRLSKKKKGILRGFLVSLDEFQHLFAMLSRQPDYNLVSRAVLPSAHHEIPVSSWVKLHQWFAMVHE
jgi:hypothetical protein